MMTTDKYQSGFGNEFATEAIKGALPVGQNSPQRPPHGLYAEQLSGTAFTAPNAENKRSWLYRILPSVKHAPFEAYGNDTWQSSGLHPGELSPNQLRWSPLEIPKQKIDFVDSFFSFVMNGHLATQVGCAVHQYTATTSMLKKSFFNADGELLIIPQQGSLKARTEMGHLAIEPGEILIIPRGIKFSIDLMDGPARGFVCENYGNHFELPYRGAMGANGLANPRDFLSPVAAYEDKQESYELHTKFGGKFFKCSIDHNPYDVVAWHGNYTPYKYDLRTFNTIGSISFDHPDPSIFTVLTSASAKPGTANIDFVIFPPRWLVAEDSFRPPWFHRNIMSEFMGLIYGVYDAKPDAAGFAPGGASLHNCMSAHGPETAAFEAASQAQLKPEKLDQTMAFMIESNLAFETTSIAMNHSSRQKDYAACWQGLKSNFKP